MEQDENDVARRFEEMLTEGMRQSEGEEDERTKFLGHFAGGHRLSHQKNEHHSLEEGSESTQVYYYRSRLCYLLPRLFYVTLAILALYLVFWICCAVPTAMAARAARMQRNGQLEAGGSVAIMTSPDGKLKKVCLI